MDGLMTNCFPGDTTQYSVDDTFNKLRRVDYNIACAEYCLICLDWPNSAGEPSVEILDEKLKSFGWTMAELTKESRRREQNGDY